MTTVNGHGAKAPPPSSDPSIYANEIEAFSKQGQPTSAKGWLDRAKTVAQTLARDAASRDIAQHSPRAEIALLKASSLTKVLAKVRHGGGGESWEVAYKVIREVAKGDGSIGMLLGYHLLWSVTAVVVGDERQADGIGKIIVHGENGEGYFVGGLSHVPTACVGRTPNLQNRRCC